MKAITLTEFGTQPALRADLPAPTPGPGEVLVRVRASSVNPVDNAIVAGMLKDLVEHEFPITLGRDYAGVVEEVGAEVTGFSVRDEVFGSIRGMSPAVHAGSWAELIVVPESMSIVRRPESVDLATAGPPWPPSPRWRRSTHSRSPKARRCSSSAPPAGSAAPPPSLPWPRAQP